MPRKKKNEETVETQSYTDEKKQTNIQTMEEIKESSNHAKPPKLFKRNEFGLIDGVEYKYRDDGFIDWRAMVRPEHLYPNKDKTTETDISKLRDDQLVIKLGGLKDLARIRGFKSVEFETNIPSSSYVASTCKITWIPNYETEGREVVYSASSSAHLNNVNDFCEDYLAEMSTNRSFVRAVRNFLNIDIVAHEELFDKSKKTAKGANQYDHKTANDPHEPLRETLMKKGMTFDQLKEKCIASTKNKFRAPNEWTKLEDIPKSEVFYLLGALNNKQ